MLGMDLSAASIPNGTEQKGWTTGTTRVNLRCSENRRDLVVNQGDSENQGGLSRLR